MILNFSFEMHRNIDLVTKIVIFVGRDHEIVKKESIQSDSTVC